MGIIPELSDMFAEEVEVQRRRLDPTTHEPMSDRYGNPVYEEGWELVPCRITGSQEQVVTRDNEAVSSKYRMTCAGVFGLTAFDRYRLPARYSPREPVPLNAYPVDDEDGPHHDVVIF